jgi:hypothetical protein
VSDNNANTKEDAVAPSMNPEDRPDLQDYMSKDHHREQGIVAIVVNIVTKPFRQWNNLLLITERNIQSHFNKNNFFN